MNSMKQRESLILLLGDVFFFMVSLWISLAIRMLRVPTKEIFDLHLRPFGFLFIIWTIVFYIAGLYEKRILLLRSKLPGVIFNAQVGNALLGVAFFYFFPFYGIAPKTLLFIYLLVSFLIMILWRVYLYFLIRGQRVDRAIILGSGEDMRELSEEVNRHNLFNLEFISSIDLDQPISDKNFVEEVVSKVHNQGVSLVVIDLSHERSSAIFPHLFDLIFNNVVFVDMHKIYEDVFNRVPLSLLKYNWFIENVSSTPRVTYDALKRFMDLILSFVLGLFSLLVYPFVMILIKYEDGGPVFISQERIGKENKIFKIHKFRTMTDNDHGSYGESGKSELHVTKIGKFLRDARIDELPQLWSVFNGDQSLVGPRPELPRLASLYEKEIPYYNIRHLIKPGLSGWAQIYQENHPHHGEAILETTEKLAYDFFYIKNRSFLFDLKIAIRTIKTLLSREGK